MNVENLIARTNTTQQTNITKKKHVITFKSNVDETNVKGKIYII